MKSVINFIFILPLILLTGNAGAQITKPELIEVNFLVSGKSVTTTSNGDVTVELKFDKDMNQSVDPIVKFGLSEPFGLNVPKGQGWIDGRLWQGFFTVSENNPPTNDGKYIFHISNAESVTNVKMDTTLSTALNKFLNICRAGELALSTTTLNFGSIVEGTTKSLSFTITNNSCAELNISNISVPAPFSLVNSSSSFTISGESNRELTILFNPTSRSNYSTNLTVSSNDRLFGTNTVQLIGSAHGPKIALSPSSLLSFGKVKVGFELTKTVLVTNQGATNSILSDTLHISNITTNGSIYTVTPNTLTIPPDSTKSVEVKFKPTSHQLYNGFILSFFSDDLQQSLRTIVLDGDARDEVPPPPLTNLNVTWPGYNGLTNGANLSICWANPQDPSGIAEIWWKFTTSPIPPQSATDTTSAGGRYLLNSEENCASLPLLGRISSGFWYCYLWLVDGNGNSNYASAVQTSFSYDILAPAKPTIIGRSIPADRWFGADEEFNLTIGIPTDAVRGSRDAKEVRWKYKTKPVSASDYQGRYIFTSPASENVLFTVPFNSESLCGDYDLYIWLADSAFNSNSENFTIVPYKFDICSKIITNITPTWSGFAGFTNAANLNICWDNPNNAGVVNEIWWKFSRTPVSPQSAVDTTNFGGKLRLSSNANCASLPLLSKSLAPGFWYCYVWWVYANGNNSGYASTIQTSFVYDVTPPRSPIYKNQSIPSLQWFGKNKTFKLTIDIPTDVSRGIKDAAEVRWKYQSPPNSASDFDGNFALPGTKTEGLEFTIPFTSTSLCGEDSLFYWLADSAGNSSNDSTAFVKYRFDICPPSITRIHTNTHNIADLRQTFLDTVRITDDVGVDSTWIRYRFGGADTPEPPQKINRISASDSFVVVIPAAGVTRRGIEYKVIALDSLDNEGTGPKETGLCENDDNWFPVRTRVDTDFRIDSDGSAQVLLSGDNETNYQLFSVPYMLDSSKVMEVLQDDLGVYDPTKWRLFDYDTQNSKFLEGDTARTFIPGRAFFIITNQENIVVDSGPGETHKTVCNDTLELFEGWNLIATPFNFPVGRESLTLLNSNSVISLRSYERGWNISPVMDPWRGYAMYVARESASSNDDPIQLVVAPKAVPGRATKIAVDNSGFYAGEWRIQISAKAGDTFDLENWAGVENMANSGFDDRELVEPPVIGKYVKVSFPHPEWNLHARDFSTDIRPAGLNEQVWEFEVSTNQPHTQVDVNFILLGNIPGNAEIHLIDEAHKLAQNLRASSVYSFKSGKNGITKKLKLIVGSQEFASSQAGDIALVPEIFALLQNFPNPFNPETSIRYNLPEASKVQVEVFDLLGKRVQTLVNSEQQSAGYYTINWNGSDAAGRKVASGVYIYRITTDAYSSAKKMILMK